MGKDRSSDNQEALKRIKAAQKLGEIELDLSDLGLRTLPPEIGSLTALLTLDLAGNQLTTLPPEIGSLTALQILELRNNQLATLPPEIGSLTALQMLELRNNQLATLPPEIGSLTALQTLELSNNQLTTLPPEIGWLTALQTLALYSNKITELPTEIGNLKSLQLLGLSHGENRIKAIPKAVWRLTALEELGLTGNEIAEIASDINSLYKLKLLFLGKNSLTTLPPEIGSLTALQTLELNNNQLTTLPPEIGSLTALQTLELNNNQLTTLPPEIGSLTALQTLFLCNNQFTTLPPKIGSLAALTTLDLRRNSLDSLSVEMRKLTQLEGLYLHGNPKLGLSPAVLGSDLVARPDSRRKPASPQAIFDVYFSRGKGAARPLNEVKLIVVGRGAAGKTSIARALKGLPFRKGELSTPGIALSDWKIKGCKHGDVTAHIWDFAGQVITHALHQFFFSVRSIYVLALTGRENSEREDAEYWLRLIKAFGTEDGGVGPSVVVALNKWDVKGCRPKVDRGALVERYPFIRGFIEVDCKSKRGVAKLQKSLKQEVTRLKWLHEPFPAAWNNVRKELTKSGKGAAYLTFNAFRKMCDRHKITDQREQESLAEILHNLGSALNYRNDPRLREATVLKPQWLTKNVYSLVRKAEKQAGVLKRADVDSALAKVSEPRMRDYLVRLMERFEIAYGSQKTSSGPWVVPQALPDVQPEHAKRFASQQDATRLRYTYGALPEGLVAGATVRLHEFIDEKNDKKQQWASGAILTREGAHALVRAEPQNRQVMVTVTGPSDARRQLAGLCQAEMRDIHNDIPGLDPLEETQVDGAWVATATLEMDELKGTQTGVPTTDRGTVSIDPVSANNAYSKQDSRVDQIWKPTAFICYSKNDIRKRERLELELKVLLNEGKLAGHWHDRMIDPGDSWNPAILRQLNEAHIIIVMLSTASLATDYIRDTEIPTAMQLHEAGSATVVPLILEKCRWAHTKTKLGELQGLPDKGKPIDLWEPRSKGWNSVANGLAAVCEKLIKQR